MPKTVKKTASKPKPTGISVGVVGVDGKAAGRMTLPKELFGAKINKPLLAQAVRVYLANQRSGSASTKTRGEVEGSTRKIYRQKGTGRARHGAIRAPIFVGGGIVFGPKPRDYSLTLPKKMKKAALTSALTSQLQEGNIIVVDGFEKMKPKTKLADQTFENLEASDKTLLIIDREAKNLVRASRNLPYVDILPVNSLNAYDALSHKRLVFTKSAIEELKK